MRSASEVNLVGWGLVCVGCGTGSRDHHIFLLNIKSYGLYQRLSGTALGGSVSANYRGHRRFLPLLKIKHTVGSRDKQMHACIKKASLLRTKSRKKTITKTTRVINHVRLLRRIRRRPPVPRLVEQSAQFGCPGCFSWRW